MALVLTARATPPSKRQLASSNRQLPLHLDSYSFVGAEATIIRYHIGRKQLWAVAKSVLQRHLEDQQAQLHPTELLVRATSHPSQSNPNLGTYFYPLLDTHPNAQACMKNADSYLLLFWKRVSS